MYIIQIKRNEYKKYTHICILHRLKVMNIKSIHKLYIIQIKRNVKERKGV